MENPGCTALPRWVNYHHDQFRTQPAGSAVATSRRVIRRSSAGRRFYVDRAARGRLDHGAADLDLAALARKGSRLGSPGRVPEQPTPAHSRDHAVRRILRRSDSADTEQYANAAERQRAGQLHLACIPLEVRRGKSRAVRLPDREGRSVRPPRSLDLRIYAARGAVRLRHRRRQRALVHDRDPATVRRPGRPGRIFS